MMRTTKLLVTAILLMGSLGAHAALVDIDIVPSNGTFTMTGSFDYDAGNQTYSDLTINLTGDIGPFIFNDTACESCPMSGSGVGLIDPTFAATYFLSDLVVTWGGGALTATFEGGSFVLRESRGRLDGTYSLNPAQAVSAPGTFALLGLGLAILGFSRRNS